jgi:hypothetical protein
VADCERDLGNESSPGGQTPKFSRTEGKTPAPPHQEVQRLLDSIDVTHLVGLRDRALLAVMAYTKLITPFASWLPWIMHDFSKPPSLSSKVRGNDHCAPTKGSGALIRRIDKSKTANPTANLLQYPKCRAEIAVIRRFFSKSICP